MVDFDKIRRKIIGDDILLKTQYGELPLIYVDWIASGRLYRPIEQIIAEQIGPWVGNTHTETSITGTLMTKAYNESKKIIKAHVHASEKDVLLNTGFGMTSGVNKLQRMLGLKYCGKLHDPEYCLGIQEKPVVFISHMEHHSNHTSWYETIADVVLIPPGKDLLIDLNILEDTVKKYKDRSIKIGSFIAASNVTGVKNPIHKMAAIMHKYNGICLIDYAAAAPYMDINMHKGKDEYFDGIFFSPHKFLGGPGSSGVLIFNSDLYDSHSPDNPGGGTVEWTNPWGEYSYISDIEVREDGGTPGFLQAMRTALSIRLKEKMGTKAIIENEEELVIRALNAFEKIQGVHVLAEEIKNRLGVISFYHEDIHYNLIVKLLNDRFGIQARGGCACAGTYGHYLLDVTYEKSKNITELINSGNLSQKPGWVRLSFHPTMRLNEIDYIVNAIGEISKNHKKWVGDYQYNPKNNEFFHKNEKSLNKQINKWFTL